jgi:MYXO-CTERM domain-containing protein
MDQLRSIGLACALMLGAQRADAACPEGAEVVRESPPAALIEACQRPDGTQHGRYASWHPNGEKFTEGQYREGKQHGKWTRWHANGQKSYEGHWRDDKKHGTTTLWTVHGVKEAQMEFHEGWFVPWSFRVYWAEDGQEALGCGCTSSPAPARLWLVLAILAWTGGRRRKRFRGTPTHCWGCAQLGGQ